MSLRPRQADPLRARTVADRRGLVPNNMERLHGASPEQVRALQEIALSIFTDVSNNGFSLREALSAIYLSGLQHGSQLMRETQHESIHQQEHR